jgi:hypothetical protein
MYFRVGYISYAHVVLFLADDTYDSLACSKVGTLVISGDSDDLVICNLKVVIVNCVVDRTIVQ